MKHILLVLTLLAHSVLNGQIIAEVSIVNDSTLLLEAWPDITGKGISPTSVDKDWRMFTPSSREYNIKQVKYATFTQIKILVDTSYFENYNAWEMLVLLYKPDEKGQIPIFPVARVWGRSNVDLHAAARVENLIRKLSEQ